MHCVNMLSVMLLEKFKEFLVNLAFAGSIRHVLSAY